jgi:hypothetical protein
MNASGQASATPILDLELPLPTAPGDDLTRNEMIGILSLITLGIAVVVVTGKYVLLVFVGFFLVLLPINVIHEVGHMIAGCIVGFRFRAVGSGPLWVERKSGSWKVRTRRVLFGGYTIMSLDRIRRVRRRLIIFTAGGPAATALSACIAFCVAAGLEDPFKTLVGFWGIMLGLDGLLSLMPIRLLPRMHEVVPDGVSLRTLLTSKEGTTQLIAAMALDLLRNNNVDRLRWNPRWTKAAHGQAALSGQGFVHDWNAYASAETAAIKAEHLERCLAASGPLAPEGREQVIVEAAYFTAWWRDNAAKADVWLARVARPENVSRYSLMRAEVALHCAHRQFDKALDCWERGLVWLQSLPEPWVRRFEHGWSEWRAEVEKRRAERSLAEQTSTTQQA